MRSTCGLGRWPSMLLLAASLLPMSTRGADAFPDKTAHILVGFVPGGGVDAIARVIASKLTVMWGQPVIVENRAGASGFIAAGVVARAPPDGYWVVMANSTSHTLGPQALKAPFNALKDFTLITTAVRAPNILVVNADSKIDSMKALGQLAKAHPGTMSYASSGNGSYQQLAGAVFSHMTGGDLLHVPYKGSAAALIDVMGGQVSMDFETSGAALPLIKSGKVKALAVMASHRLAEIPEVPTSAEAGYPDFEISTWYGLAGPAGMPEALVQKWQSDVAKILAMPDVRKQIELIGGEPVGDTSAAFKASYEAEYRRTGTMMKQAGIVPES
jgi:tripartite-type tricarboxylate transporter receptor subunit TctC